MEIRANFEYMGKIYPVIIKKRKQSRILVRYNGIEFLVSSPKYYTKSFILDSCKSAFISILSKQKVSLIDESGMIKGLYIFGEFKPLDDGFIDVLGHQILFTNLDDFYTKIKPIVYDKFYCLFKECELETGSKITHEFKLVKVKGYFGINMIKKHIIKLNLCLVHYHEDVIKGVIYHELAHDFVANHSKDFYNKLASFDKFYKEHNKIVKNKDYERSCL